MCVTHHHNQNAVLCIERIFKRGSEAHSIVSYICSVPQSTVHSLGAGGSDFMCAEAWVAFGCQCKVWLPFTRSGLHLEPGRRSLRWRWCSCSTGKHSVSRAWDQCFFGMGMGQGSKRNREQRQQPTLGSERGLWPPKGCRDKQG